MIGFGFGFGPWLYMFLEIKTQPKLWSSSYRGLIYPLSNNKRFIYDHLKLYEHYTSLKKNVWGQFWHPHERRTPWKNCSSFKIWNQVMDKLMGSYFYNVNQSSFAFIQFHDHLTFMFSLLQRPLQLQFSLNLLITVNHKYLFLVFSSVVLDGEVVVLKFSLLVLFILWFTLDTLIYQCQYIPSKSSKWVK